jgi:hypothetical protein
MTFAFWLLSHVQADTSLTTLSLWMLVLGIGVGSTMQVLVLAVQNGVEYRDMGTAVSLNTFFRTMGGAFGTAIFGAILTTQLTANLTRLLPGGAKTLDLAALQGAPKQIHSLPPPVLNAVIESFVRAYHVVFLAAVPFAVVAFFLALVLPEVPLRGGAPSVSEAGDIGDDATRAPALEPIAEPAI